MHEQFGGVYWQNAVNVSAPINNTYVRLFRDLADGMYKIKKFGGTIELFTGGGSGALSFRGDADLSGGLFPITGGSGIAGAIQAGDTWIVSVSGTVCGTLMAVGDLIIAKVAIPAQVCANWSLIEVAGSYVPFVGAGSTVNLNTQSLIAGKFTLGITAGHSVLELDNADSGVQLILQAKIAGVNTIDIELGAIGSLSGFHFSGPAWFADKNMRFDTAAAAQIYTNNGDLGIGINGANDIGGSKGIFIQGDGNLRLANQASGFATLAGGTVTVLSNKVTATSKIHVTAKNSLAGGVAVGVPYEDSASRVVGTSFIINSHDLSSNLVVTDIRDITWTIVE